MKNKKIKILMCLILIFSITIISACTDNNGTGNDVGQDGTNNNNNQKDSNNNGINQDGNDEGTTKPDQDVDLTAKLLSDEEVSDGQIYLRKEWAIGVMTLKDEVSVERAKEKADEYGQQIKEKYPDKKVNVQVVLNGENVANIEL